MTDFLSLLTEVPMPAQQQQQPMQPQQPSQPQPPPPQQQPAASSQQAPSKPAQQQKPPPPVPTQRPAQKPGQKPAQKPTVPIPPQAPVLTKHGEDADKGKKKEGAVAKKVEFREGEFLRDSSLIHSKYFIRKHSWRGKSIRSICFTDDKLITINPSTCEILSVWDFKDFINVAPLIKSSEEFTISIRKATGKIDKNTYSSNFRPYLLASLSQALSKYNPSK